jgi:glycosyltransferase involved in cell wall biosynthesis
MENKKKILFVITKSNFGGAQRYVYDLATSVPQDEYEPVVALGGTGALKVKLDERGIRTISIERMERDIKLLADIGAFFELIRILFREKPAIVHLNSSKAGALGALAARIAGAPRIVFTAHGWAFTEGRGVFARFAILYIQWMTVMLTHVTIAVSHAVRDTMTIHVPLSKLVVIHNGISTPAHKDRTSARKELIDRGFAQNTDALWVATIAELHPNKGLDYAISAIEQVNALQPIAYAILGEGEDRDQLMTLIQNKSLGNKVFLLGFTPSAATLLKAFDIFLLPSLKEGLPYVALEAGSAGLPVVASHVDGLPEIIESGVSGILVEPRNIEELADAITDLADSPHKRTQYGLALRDKILKSFSKERMVRETVEVYEDA